MDNDLTFDPTLRAIVSPEIRHGEKVLWIGKPTPLRVVMQQHGEELVAAAGSAVMAIIFFSVFPSFGMMSFSFSNAIFSPFTVLTVVFGAIMIFTAARPAYAFWQALRTVYVVTDYRALILKPTFNGMSVASYPNVERVERTSLAGGKGDLIFGNEPYRARGRYGSRTRYRKIGFFGISEVRRVEDLLLENIPGGQYPEFND